MMGPLYCDRYKVVISYIIFNDPEFSGPALYILSPLKSRYIFAQLPIDSRLMNLCYSGWYDTDKSKHRVPIGWYDQKDK
jgi:hypothetical protein